MPAFAIVAAIIAAAPPPAPPGPLPPALSAPILSSPAAACGRHPDLDPAGEAEPRRPVGLRRVVDAHAGAREDARGRIAFPQIQAPRPEQRFPLKEPSSPSAWATLPGPASSAGPVASMFRRRLTTGRPATGSQARMRMAEPRAWVSKK